MSVLTSPNITGFKAAQDRLRLKLGMDVTVYVPITAAYPPGTVIDESTGRPYDPMIKGSGGFASATLRASVLYDRLVPEDKTETNAAGIFQAQSVGLNLAIEDWAVASAATEFDVLGQRYEIRDARPDGVGNIPTRMLIYGERR